ncbi:MAG: indole-3-glycerol phosphate synthase TrpC [Planctomycetota bacterium]|nr:indole-3-glycerol phosphate synthase TrpC [Planctomycetota bacterium]
METIQLVLHYLLLALAAIMVLKAGVFVLVAFLTVLFRPRTVAEIYSDLEAIKKDPAVESLVAAMFYPGWWALTIHRLAAHPLYNIGLKTPARLVNFGARFMTGADIHPGAQFGRGIFIDHANGVVIGETAVVGDNVTMLHQVTLGGTGKEGGKRHPTVEEGVLLSAGSKILGNIVVGKNSKIGAGSVVVKAVPPESTVVGIPGRVVATSGKRIPSQTLDSSTLPDPVVDKLVELQDEVRNWEKRLQEAKSKVNDEERDVLAEIVAHKKTEVASARGSRPVESLKNGDGKRGVPRSFYQALCGPGLALIAEIKKASPSGGLLREDFDPQAIAKIYEGAHASALSVLTDEKYFQGSLEYLAQARQAATLPILRKDFIVDEYQIHEAAHAGADAILLIVACLDDRQLRGFRETAESIGLDALVEVHGEEELMRARASGAKIIGINNRNLRTLRTDLDTTFRLLSHWPKAEREGVVIVSESGIKSPDDIHALAKADVNAVLIGETFMRSPDIASKVREVMGHGEFAI